jgi:hypothetical protein
LVDDANETAPKTKKTTAKKASTSKGKKDVVMGSDFFFGLGLL